MSRNFPPEGDHNNLAGSWNETDIVKKGCLHIKESTSLSFMKFKFKSWQARFLILRDSWSHMDSVGETVLEIFPPNIVESNPLPSCNFSSKLPVKISSSSSSSTTSSSSSSGYFPSLGILRESSRERCIDLKSVKYVDVHRTSRTFPHAFIVHRDDKPPLIFGAKSDLEMREWLMAIKLLADKACKISQTSNVPRVRSLLASDQSKDSVAGSNFRCFVVNVVSSELEASAYLISKLSGQFLFCVNPCGVMKIVSRQNNNSSNCKSKSFSESPKDGSDGDDSNGSNGSEETREEICQWKVDDVRKLKSENVPGKKEYVVTLETSSRCKDHPGKFKFHTSQGLELIQYVRSVAYNEVPAISKSSDDVQRDKRERNRFRSEGWDPADRDTTNHGGHNIPKPPPRPLFTISNP